MLRYIITKRGKVYKSCGQYHCEIMIAHHLSYNEIAEEGIVDKGIRYIVSRQDVILPTALQKARELETLYTYGFIKEGD